MPRMLEMVDPEYERRTSRQRKVLFLVVLISLGIFSYPVAKDYEPQWRTLKAARKLSLYLSMLKTRAILNKTPLEARFKDTDHIEVFEVSSCGPQAQRTKLYETKLSEFEEGVVFANEKFVRDEMGSKDPILPRFCYDPLFGSSIHADGLVRGGIFLAHHLDISNHRGDRGSAVIVETASGDVSIE